MTVYHGPISQYRPCVMRQNVETMISGKSNPVDPTRHKGFKIQQEHLNGPLAEPANFKYIAFPSRNALRQKGNYKTEGSEESPELFWSAG